MFKSVIVCVLLAFSSQGFATATLPNTDRELKPNNLSIQFPEAMEATVDPEALRPISESWFNFEVFPQIDTLQFYSHKRKDWFPIPHHKIQNNCFARRMLVDLFLWGENSLVADIESENGDQSYLTSFLKTQDFMNLSWIETARIQVVGKLRAGEIFWDNHEAVLVKTENGLRVVDPSFANKVLSIDRWFFNFAPSDFPQRCVHTDVKGLRKINTEMVKEKMGSPWNPSVPKCGYVFKQRLDAMDVSAGAERAPGAELEKMLSRHLSDYMENRLLPVN